MSEVPRRRRLLLVDDDAIFCKIFKHEAAKEGISVIVCISLDNPELLSGQTFDAAVVDYDLAGVRGDELGPHLVKVLGDTPIVLISSRDRVAQGGAWPPCIKTFVNKQAGNQAILASVLTLIPGT